MKWEKTFPEWTIPEEIEPRYYPEVRLYGAARREEALAFVANYAKQHPDWTPARIETKTEHGQGGVLNYIVIGSAFGYVIKADSTEYSRILRHEYCPFARNWHELFGEIESVLFTRARNKSAVSDQPASATISQEAVVV